MEEPEVPAEDQRPTDPTETAPDGTAPAGTGSASPGSGTASPSRTRVESTGTETSGPTGGAEPFVPHEPGEPHPIDLVDPTASAFAKWLVPALAATVVGVLVVLFLRRRRT